MPRPQLTSYFIKIQKTLEPPHTQRSFPFLRKLIANNDAFPKNNRKNSFNFEYLCSISFCSICFIVLINSKYFFQREKFLVYLKITRILHLAREIPFLVDTWVICISLSCGGGPLDDPNQRGQSKEVKKITFLLTYLNCLKTDNPSLWFYVECKR